MFEPRMGEQALTLLWVVGMMNSINMLDNMDAITTVTSICILACGLLVHLTSGPRVTINMVLDHRGHRLTCGLPLLQLEPARMYMGDTGSQFLGVFLAYVGIRCFWNGYAVVVFALLFGLTRRTRRTP
ncbi:MAG: hypothetical protein IPN38_05995 [Flavobacteriales bacterium]|nr:hypothetical protein [Flavobacteriales bacterium]